MLVGFWYEKESCITNVSFPRTTFFCLSGLVHSWMQLYFRLFLASSSPPPPFSLHRSLGNNKEDDSSRWEEEWDAAVRRRRRRKEEEATEA